VKKKSLKGSVQGRGGDRAAGWDLAGAGNPLSKGGAVRGGTEERQGSRKGKICRATEAEEIKAQQQQRGKDTLSYEVQSVRERVRVFPKSGEGREERRLRGK